MRKKPVVIEPVAGKTILDEFDRRISLFEDFEKKINLLLSDILKHHSISFHKVESRVKSRDSLKRKCEIKNKYSSLDEITDILGFRVILFFKEDVDLLKDILKEEFELLDSFTSDRRVHNVNEFGYTSLHIVLRLNEDRKGLLEYSQFPDIRFEVQLRTILQHSWAEIEHDIGYKARIDVPGEIQRSFARLAGLIELADEEFSRIRETINSFKSSSLSFPDIKADPISTENLSRFASNNETLGNIAEKIANVCNLGITSDTSPQMSGGVEHRLIHTYYRYIFEVKEDLKKYEDDIVAIAILGLGTVKKGNLITKKIGLIYLCLFKKLLERRRDEYERYCRDFGIPKKIKEKALWYFEDKYGDTE